MAAELIIQLQQPDGSFSCELLENFPGIRSAYVAICFSDGLTAQTEATVLYQELISAVMSLDAAVVRGAPPCGGQAVSFGDCRALPVVETIKLLLVVSDGLDTTINVPGIFDWTHTVLPILQRQRTVNLPEPFDLPEAAFWDTQINEVIPTIFGLTGISDPDQKLFISYRRIDSEPLAIQLFDQLSQAHFEVFLDRFSITPGVNFQQRLYQELSDKAMVLFIESPHFLESDWVKLEVDFAKRYRLGLLAINIDGAPQIGGIGSESRIMINAVDLTTDGKLAPNKLTDIIKAIRQYHALSLYRMKHYLDTNIIAALNGRGLHASADPHGFICANGFGGQAYKIWTTPRPAAINDYHYTDTLKQNHEHGIVIGPGFIDFQRTKVNKWLSNKSEVRFYPEGELLHMVNSL